MSYAKWKRWVNRISFSLIISFISRERFKNKPSGNGQVVTRWHHNSDEYEYDAMLHHRSPTICAKKIIDREKTKGFIRIHYSVCVSYSDIPRCCSLLAETLWTQEYLMRLHRAKHFRNSERQSSSIWVKTLINSFHFRWRFCVMSISILLWQFARKLTFKLEKYKVNNFFNEK